MTAFLASKWPHVLLVALIAGLAAGLPAAGVHSDVLNAILPLIAGAVGAHSGKA